MTRALAQPSWLATPTSSAARSATSRSVASLANASRPMIEALRFGSSAISSRPGWM
jgi:hypothetical protein